MKLIEWRTVICKDGRFTVIHYVGGEPPYLVDKGHHATEEQGQHRADGLNSGAKRNLTNEETK